MVQGSRRSHSLPLVAKQVKHFWREVWQYIKNCIKAHILQTGIPFLRIFTRGIISDICNDFCTRMFTTADVHVTAKILREKNLNV